VHERDKMIKKPFVNYRVGEANPLEEGRIISVRLNATEYTALLEMGRTLSIPRDSTTLKTLAQIGSNVILNTFGADVLRWLADGERRKDELSLSRKIAHKGENVTQKNEVL